MICPKQTTGPGSASKRIKCRHYLPVDGESSGLCMLSDEFVCVLDLDARAPRLSHSTVTDFLTCKRLYWHKNIKGIAVKNSTKSPALKMGVLWDTCIGVLLGQTDKTVIPKVISQYEIAPRDVARVKALHRGFKQLGIVLDPVCEFQQVFIQLFQYRDTDIHFVVKGILDRCYPADNYFAETKLSSRPDFYLKLFNIMPQCGIYFLSDPNLQFVTMEVTRPPDLKSVGKFADETDREYEERCFRDILSRPAFYFIGYSRDTKTFGKKYYRTEFPLDEIEKRLSDVFYEITDCAARDAFHKNYRACYSPFQCEYLQVCQFDTWSEEIYYQKEKKEVMTDDRSRGVSL